MLLRPWIGANDAAIAMRMPQYFSHCAAVSRELPVPLRNPETITSKLPSRSARAGTRRLPSAMSPAYAFLAISLGS